MAKINDEKVLIKQENGEDENENKNLTEKLTEEKEEESDNEYVSVIGDTEECLTKKDPFNVKKVFLGLDYYSLTWIAISKKTFNKISVRGQKIFLLPQDYFSLYFYFLVFVFALFITILLILQEAILEDVYIEGTYQLILLRMLLVVFTLVNIGEEVQLAYAKFLFPIINRDKFHHPGFATFIGFCHLITCITSILGLLFFICMADEFADPVINFAGICVLIELDNWVGDAIQSCRVDQDYLDNLVRDDNDGLAAMKDHDKLEEIVLKNLDEGDDPKKVIKKTEKERGKYRIQYLNENLSWKHKLALINEAQLEIHIDENIYKNAPWYIVIFEKAVTYIPWKIVLPLSTYPLSIMLPTITTWLRKVLNRI